MQTILSWLPFHVLAAMTVMDARMFYELAALAVAAPIVAAVALNHWRRTHTWRAVVVITELVCFASAAVAALAFNVISLDPDPEAVLVLLAGYYVVVRVLSYGFDGVAAVTEITRRKLTVRRLLKNAARVSGSPPASGIVS